MDQSALFRRFQRGCHLQGDIDRRQNMERSYAANTLLERFAFDQFHRVKKLTGFLTHSELIYSRHIWVT